MSRELRTYSCALCLLAAVVLLGGCRLTKGLVTKPPSEEHGQPLECESDQPAAPVAEPPPAEAKKGDTIPFHPSEDGMVSPFSPPRGEIRKQSRRVSVGGQTVAVTILDVPLGSVSLRVGLAKGRVGATESLANIARRHGAVAAINGSFFDAYSKRPVRNPYGALVTGGQTPTSPST